MSNEKLESKNFVLPKDTYIHIGFLAVFGFMIVYAVDTRNGYLTNTDFNIKLNKKLDNEIALVRREREFMRENINDDLREIKEEQKFLRERLMDDMDDIKKLIYKFDVSPSKKK